MKQTKQRQPFRIRTKMIINISVFTVIALAALTAFQLIFLDDLYRITKTRSVMQAVKEVAVSLEEGDPIVSVDYWKMTEQMSVYVVNKNGMRLFQDTEVSGQIRKVSDGELLAIYDVAKKNGGVYYERLEMEVDPARNLRSTLPPEERRDPPEKPVEKRPEYYRDSMDMVYYGELVEVGNEDPYLVLGLSAISPVEATQRTLATQLGIASIIIIGFAIVLGINMARRVGVPIEILNRSAKGLADGTYISPGLDEYSEIVQLNETLDRVSMDLKKNERYQQEFIANISHDLRTPLTMITGYSEMIRDLPDEDVGENIQVVIDEVNRLSELVNSILNLAKLQSGTEMIDKTPVDLTNLIEQTTLRFQQMLEAEGYAVEFDANTHIMVMADELRLSQAIYNLLSNALDYCGEDRLVRVVQEVKEHTVRVSFIDHGKGIPQKEIDNIWERYYRVRKKGKRGSTANRGLGLSIVQSVIHLHGGQCGVDSEEGKGSTFWFELGISPSDV